MLAAAATLQGWRALPPEGPCRRVSACCRRYDQPSDAGFGITSGAAQRSPILYGCAGIFLGQAGLFIDLPALPLLARDFQVSAAASQETITAYALGYGLSQLAWGPLSDGWGRRSTALTGLALFSLASLLVPIGLAMPMQSFPSQAGQASALTGFLQQEGSGLVVALAVGIPISSQVPLALALLVIAGILALLVRAYGRLGASR